MTNKLITKAKECKSAEELLALAKENGIEMSAEEAKAKYAELHNEGELSDDELDQAAGGGCHKKDGRLSVTIAHYCDHFICKDCGKPSMRRPGHDMDTEGSCMCGGTMRDVCNNCKYMSYESGWWYCNNEANREA